jgi:GT2 family glycosyltransferase
MESLMRQTFRDFSILVVDNGSDDETVNFLRSNYPTVNVLQNFKNLGFARANNQGMLMAKSDYILALNPDVILTENFLEKLLSFADQHPEAGTFGGKILKLKSEFIDGNDKGGMLQAVRSNIFDSAGLQIFKSRRVIDRGEGTADQGQYDRPEEVFGITGACALYRKPALDEVMIRNEFFDQDFMAYKEDVDLAWRLQIYGFSAWYVPAAVCFHHRGFPASAQNNIRKVFKERKKISRIIRSYSFRNHYLMLAKNDDLANVIKFFPWIFGREFKVFFGTLIFEPFQYKSLIELFRLLPGALMKRRVIMAHRKVSAREIRKWFK